MHPGVLAGAHIEGPLVIRGALRLHTPILLVLVALGTTPASIGTVHPAKEAGHEGSSIAVALLTVWQ